MSARSQRIEVITGVERRRRWSWDRKRAIVEESLSPGASLAAIARKHGIGTGQLYTWRRQLLSPRLAGAGGFARVEMAGEPARLAAPLTSPCAGATGMIEITLADGASVRVDAGVDELALRRVLAALRG
jgi:transposase